MHCAGVELVLGHSRDGISFCLLVVAEAPASYTHRYTWDTWDGPALCSERLGREGVYFNPIILAFCPVLFVVFSRLFDE